MILYLRCIKYDSLIEVLTLHLTDMHIIWRTSCFYSNSGIGVGSYLKIAVWISVHLDIVVLCYLNTDSMNVSIKASYET